MRLILAAAATIIISLPAMAQDMYMQQYPNGTYGYSIQHGSPLSGGNNYESGTMVPFGQNGYTTFYSNGMQCNSYMRECTR